MSSDNAIQYIRVNYFAMSEDCVYSFEDVQILNVLPVRGRHQFIVVNRYFDKLFIGVGDTPTEAVYDWKMKFHFFFQRFSRLGPCNPFEENMFNTMQKIINVDAYDRNSTTNKTVLGTIEDCRFKNKCPSAFRLEGSDEICKVPPYEYVDPSFILLRRGDRFRGVFEYRDCDNKLLRILSAMPIPKKSRV